MSDHLHVNSGLDLLLPPWGFLDLVLLGTALQLPFFVPPFALFEPRGKAVVMSDSSSAPSSSAPGTVLSSSDAG